MPDDERRLQEMVKQGVSAMRAAVAFKRSVVAVKTKAKQLGCPFPDDRSLRRERRALDIRPIVD
jgi:hypothetical protein